MKKDRILILRKGAFWLSFLFIFINSSSTAQVNLSGKPGLLFIPDATEIQDGTFKIGFTYNPIAYSLIAKNKNSERVLFSSLSLLKRLDFSFTLLQTISNSNSNNKIGLGDRQLDVRYLILKEKKGPSVVLAFSSPFTIEAALLTQAIVATKHFRIYNRVYLEATLGYGSPYFLYRAEDNLNNSNIFSNLKWQKKSEYRYNNGYLTGPFGGVKLDYQKKVGIMAEWDSQKLNIGAYGVIGKRWTVQAGLLNFDQVMFGSSFAVDLFKPTRKIEKLYE